MKKIIIVLVAFFLFVITGNTQAQKLHATITDSTNVTCPGDSNGTAVVTATGGIKPYSYLWMPGGETTDTATGLFAGITYTATVIDSIGDETYAFVTLSTFSSGLTAATSSSEASCFGLLNGKASVLPSGGISPYHILWNPGGATTLTDSSLSAGTYTATVTDSLGCTVKSAADVSQPAPLIISAFSYAAIADALASGGTAPYTYSWAPGGATGATVTGLAPGTYTVTVNDSNLCSNSAVVTVDTSIITYSFANISTCSDPYYFFFEVMATSSPPTIFNNCVIDISYTGGKFSGDSVSNGGVSAGQQASTDPGNENDYNILNLVNLSDSVVQITFGDTSQTSRLGLVLDSVPQALFLVVFKIQNGCKPGNVSFTNLFSTGASSYYTFSTAQYDYMDTVATVIGDSLCCPYACTDTCPYLCNPHNCFPYPCYSSDSTLDSICYLTCYDTCYHTCTVTCYDTVFKYSYTYDSLFTYYSHDFPYNTRAYYLGSISAPSCSLAITDSLKKINAGTNAKSVPPNSSILTINGYGFGSTRDSIVVNNANGPGTVRLDNMDILSWSDNQIVVRMPSMLLIDSNNTGFGITPGTGPLTVYTACGAYATANLQINYNIKNGYQSPTKEKSRPDIIMLNDTASFVWRCDTSVSNNPNAMVCIRQALKVWNCYTGVNWKLGPPDTLAVSHHYGISDIYISPPSNFPPGALMLTTPEFLNACYSYADSVSFYNQAQIQIMMEQYLPGGKKWSYDTTGTQTSIDSFYFYDAILHELGHGHGLGHINDSFSLMYYTQTPGLRVNILSGNSFPAPATLLGGLDMIYTSAALANTPRILNWDCRSDSILKPSTLDCIDHSLSVPVITENGYNLNLFPNPINYGDITISYRLSTNANVLFRILDCTGRVIIKLNNDHKPPGDYTEQININNLAKGIYLFTAIINGQCQTIKFVKI